jgi:hypothetical protein
MRKQPSVERSVGPLEHGHAGESLVADSCRHGHGDDFCPEIFGIIVVVVT